MTGVFPRHAMALALVVLAAVLPIYVWGALLQWDAQLAGQGSTDTWGQVWEYVGAGAAVWLIIASAYVVFWRRVTVWPMITLLAIAPGLVPAVITSLEIANDYRTEYRPVISLGIAIALGAACLGLLHAIRLVTTRPVTHAMIASRLEIPFEADGLNARLCVQHDRLVLDSLLSRWKRSRARVAIPWTTLRSVRLEQVEHDTTWQVLVYNGSEQADALEYDIRPGLAIRIVGTARELLVPVSERDGKTIVAAIESRAANVERDAEPATEEAWRAMAARRRTGALTPWQRVTKEYDRTDYRPYRLLVVIAFLLTPLFTALLIAIGQVTELGDLGMGTGGMIGFGAIGVVFLFLVRSPLGQFRRFIRANEYVEAFPEPSNVRR
ncbi:hypothetical protein LWC34_37860 [Kibdelosporangium philippinense]|uniref:Uncharacterized protein n=1 Tax=Kibdelosporangium philippinense TaxID=211113 RepID=A0ABS8ZPZ1_9PSEU|nr:hypothetical protein [Kibdelosporangium philippinense]MCE7008538.1 hypothetical protein [Kibdelosporangium philippinense]